MYATVYRIWVHKVPVYTITAVYVICAHRGTLGTQSYIQQCIYSVHRETLGTQCVYTTKYHGLVPRPPLGHSPMSLSLLLRILIRFRPVLMTSS